VLGPYVRIHVYILLISLKTGASQCHSPLALEEGHTTINAHKNKSIANIRLQQYKQ